MDIKIDIPADANNLIYTLQEHGHSSYIVGGCVRDSIGYKPGKELGDVLNKQLDMVINDEVVSDKDTLIKICLDNLSK